MMTEVSGSQASEAGTVSPSCRKTAREAMARAVRRQEAMSKTLLPALSTTRMEAAVASSWVPPTDKVQVPESRDVPRDSKTSTVCKMVLTQELIKNPQKLTHRCAADQISSFENKKIPIFVTYH